MTEVYDPPPDLQIVDGSFHRELTFDPLGMGYSAHFRVGAAVFYFDRLRETREGLVAEMSVVDLATEPPKSLDHLRVNLNSIQSRT